MKRVFWSMACGSLLLVACAEGQEAQSDAPRPVAVASQSASQATGATERAATPAEVVTVYKSPTCGCCSKWVEHMEAAGFEVVTHDMNDLSSIKAEHGVAPQHQSCHTALVDGYVIEGHVPAEDVMRLLEERPEVVGLAAPGMPRGSPGMEMSDGTKDAYDVVAFDEAGETTVFSSH